MKKELFKNTAILLIIFISTLSIIVIKPLGDLDEIWNYNFAKNIANGLIPYKDFNMVTTPLLSILCGIILKLTTNKLIVMRILAAILNSMTIYITYRIFNVLKINKKVSILYLFFIEYLYRNILCIDYNWATLLITLLIIYYEIKKYKKDKVFLKSDIKHDIIIGILSGMAIMLKQTSGFFICIAALGNKLIDVKNKEEFKVYLKIFFVRLIGIAIPVALILSYLISNNAFEDFINYTIKGTTSFSNYVLYGNLIKFDLIGLIAVLVPLAFLYELYNNVIRDKDRKLYVLLIYGLAIFILVFPISNEIHFLISATPIIIILLYELYKVAEVFYSKYIINHHILSRIIKHILIFSLIIIVVYVIAHAVINFNKYIDEKDEFSKFNPYKYINNNLLEQQMTIIDYYIMNNEKKVIILDANAVLYMTAIDKYNKDFDMLNKGNIGKNGEEKIINKIKKDNDVQYLILNDKHKINWQAPVEIIEYVKENKKKVGEIRIFDIYE